MKILITGFDPFGGEPVNPAFEAIKGLEPTIKGAEIVTCEIPTVFTRSAAVLQDAITTHRPDAVLCVGQAGGRSAITVERVAINLADARIPDNDNEQPKDLPLQPDGKNAYFATLPTRAMVEHIQEAGIPAFLSYTAGTYVCNALMYNLLYLVEKNAEFSHIKGGFLHVPYALEQAVDKPDGTPSMALCQITRALTCALEAIASDLS